MMGFWDHDNGRVNGRCFAEAVTKKNLVPTTPNTAKYTDTLSRCVQPFGFTNKDNIQNRMAACYTIKHNAHADQ